MQAITLPRIFSAGFPYAVLSSTPGKASPILRTVSKLIARPGIDPPCSHAIDGTHLAVLSRQAEVSVSPHSTSEIRLGMVFLALLAFTISAVVAASSELSGPQGSQSSPPTQNPVGLAISFLSPTEGTDFRLL